MSYFDKKEKQEQNKDRLDKPSWRERDARNEKKSYANFDTSPAKPSSLDKRKETLAKQALNDLFTKKRPKEQSEDLRKLALLKGQTLQTEIKNYVEKYTLSNDTDELLTLLDTHDYTLFKNIITRIREGSQNETPSKKQLCISKLRILKVSHDDPDFVSLIDETLSQLGE